MDTSAAHFDSDWDQTDNGRDSDLADIDVGYEENPADVMGRLNDEMDREQGMQEVLEVNNRKSGSSTVEYRRQMGRPDGKKEGVFQLVAGLQVDYRTASYEVLGGKSGQQC
jgi:hypothetical protein